MDEAPATVDVTGIGSMPGTDPAEATRIVVGELGIPHLVELPARGPGADMLGRTLALVADRTGEFAAQTTPTGWRLAGGRSGAEPGRAMRLGAAWLAEDADRLEEQLAGAGGRVKLQVAGPWTLAAGLESVRGTRALADAGACADLAGALAEALTGHVADLRRRVPGADVVVQVDEPSLPVVLAGRVRTPSGRGALRVPELPELTTLLATVVAAARGAGAATVVAHCCASSVPFELLSRAGFAGVSVDLSAVGPQADEGLGTWWDRGGLVVLGVAPSVDPVPAGGAAGSEAWARTVDALWRRIGFGIADVGARTWLSPACGLAGASPAWARAVGGQLRRTARMLESVDT
jgi:hypothetical protein